jgi:hypothetical protein
MTLKQVLLSYIFKHPVNNIPPILRTEVIFMSQFTATHLRKFKSKALSEIGNYFTEKRFYFL